MSTFIIIIITFLSKACPLLSLSSSHFYQRHVHFYHYHHHIFIKGMTTFIIIIIAFLSKACPLLSLSSSHFNQRHVHFYHYHHHIFIKGMSLSSLLSPTSSFILTLIMKIIILKKKNKIEFIFHLFPEIYSMNFNFVSKHIFILINKDIIYKSYPVNCSKRSRKNDFALVL